MIDLEPYLTRKFNWRTYTCFHFTRDVWLDLTGVDLGIYTSDGSARGWAKAYEENSLRVIGTLVQPIKYAEDPCIVVVRTQSRLPHCGVHIGGKLLHLPKGEHGQLVPLGEITHDEDVRSVRFYR